MQSPYCGQGIYPYRFLAVNNLWFRALESVDAWAGAPIALLDNLLPHFQRGGCYYPSTPIRAA